MSNDNGLKAPATACPVTGGAGGGIEPPTAKGLPWLGVAHKVAFNKFRYADELAAQYGDIVRLPMPHKDPVFLISNVEMIQQVFARNGANVCKGAMLKGPFESVPGEPMPMLEGESWRRIRKLSQPFFSNAGLKPLLPLMDEALDDHVDALERYVRTGETVDLENLTACASFDVVARMFFNSKVPEHRIMRIARYFRLGSTAGGIRWGLFWAPRFLRHLVTLDKDIRAVPLAYEMWSMVREQKHNPNGDKSLFGAMRNVKYDDGTTITEKQLLAQMFTFVFAGFETTAAALAWTIGLLAINPEAREKAHAEASSLGRYPTVADLDQLPYLRACWDEGQRIQGIPYYSRDAKVDMELGGYRIPAGSVLLCSPQAVQHDTRYWSEPEKFKPERWIEDKIDKNTFLAFGIGERRCIGVNMANIEGPLYLAKALSKYEFSVPAGWTPKRDFHMGTTIKNGVPVTIRRR